MKMKYGLVALITACSIWFTVVQVSALRQQGNEGSSGVSGQPAAPKTVNLPVELTDRDAEIFKRIDQRLNENPQDHEASLLKSLIYFKTGHLDAAISELDILTEAAPRFHLAHLLRGDLLLSQFEEVSDIGDTALLDGLGAKDSAQIERLRLEARARLKGYLSLVGSTQVPAELVTLAAEVRRAVVVDKSQSRLYLYENAGPLMPPRLVSDFYIAYGKMEGDKLREGDLRTPEGVYKITRHIPGEKLPPMYGVGAYPINFPNELDRKLNKTGYGIWLHGTDQQFYSRPPNDSEGCVVLTNLDLDGIDEGFQLGTTPVIIAESITWLTPDLWLKQNREALQWLESWRANWESGDVESYLSYYDADFWSKGYNLKLWKERKRLVSKGKKFQRIGLNHISLMAYPEGAGIKNRRVMVAQFQQEYRSNNYNGDMWKKLYLVKDDQDWKILYEGAL